LCEFYTIVKCCCNKNIHESPKRPFGFGGGLLPPLPPALVESREVLDTPLRLTSREIAVGVPPELAGELPEEVGEAEPVAAINTELNWGLRLVSSESMVALRELALALGDREVPGGTPDAVE